MKTFTVNRVFDYLLKTMGQAGASTGSIRFGRRERIEAVFPEKLCARLASRSASYYSWFLNMDRQGGTIRDYLRSLFEEESYDVIFEMERKCRILLSGEDDAAGIWKNEEALTGLVGMMGREVPLFAHGSAAADLMERLIRVLPERVCACVFLVAGMDGCTAAQYGQLREIWRMMDRAILSGASAEAGRGADFRHRIRIAELFYLDGNRVQAIRKMELAADELRSMLAEIATPGEGGPGRQERGAGAEEIEDLQEDMGKLLLRLGEWYIEADGDPDSEAHPAQMPGGAEARAIECLQESVLCGCAEAYAPLALLHMRRGRSREAGLALVRGASAGVPDCFCMLGNAYYRGTDEVGNVRDPARAAVFYLKGAAAGNTVGKDAVCRYMLGRILEEMPAEDLCKAAEAGEELRELAGTRADPAYWYAAAARQGNADAAARLNRLRWHEAGRRASSEAGRRRREPAAPRRYCLLNSASEKNMLFADSLPEGLYTVLVCSGRESGLSAPVPAAKKHAADGRKRNANAHRPAEIGPAAAAAHREEGMTGIGCPATVAHGGESMAAALYRIGKQYLEQAQALGEAAGRGADTSPAKWLRESFPEILCLALDEEEQKNVRDGLAVLRSAFLLHEETGRFADEGGPDGEDKEDGGKTEAFFYLLSGRISAYIMGREEYAAPLFDSACSRLGDFYLPLHICDRNRMASAWLLDRLPLFIPCLEEETGGRRGLSDALWRKEGGAAEIRPRSMQVMIFGDHPGIVQMCKDMIGAAQIEDAARFPFSLTVVGENAAELEERFLGDCPGAASLPESPLFVSLRPEARRLQELLRLPQGIPDEACRPAEKMLADRLDMVNYIVVYTEEAARNLTLAMYLREWLLKTDPAFCHLPFIAAFCEKEETAQQLRTLTVGAQEPGFGWFDNYQIEAFGTDGQLFSLDGLLGDPLEERALASHISYYQFTAGAGRFRAEHDYYSRHYNRDSSRINALALSYRLFSAGITFADWHDYREGVSRECLASQFEEWLAGDGSAAGSMAGGSEPDGQQAGGRSRLERLAAWEHGRWSRAMITRGWLPASKDQALAYMQRGNPRHQLYIAKLHPFLCSWEELGEAGPAPTGVQRDYEIILRQMRPDQEPSEIRGIDRENVRRTPQILRSAEESTISF